MCDARAQVPERKPRTREPKNWKSLGDNPAPAPTDGETEAQSTYRWGNGGSDPGEDLPEACLRRDLNPGRRSKWNFPGVTHLPLLIS